LLIKMNKNPLTLALKKLSVRAYSEKELENFLVKYGFSREQIKEVLAQLLSWGYLNDQRYAANLINHYTNYKQYGYFFLYKKLQEKGIPEQIIISVLTDYDQQEELERARRLAEKYLANKVKQKSAEQLKNMLARHLSRKGFLTANIMTIINENFTY
jgi:regulatory protein